MPNDGADVRLATIDLDEYLPMSNRIRLNVENQSARSQHPGQLLRGARVDELRGGPLLALAKPHVKGVLALKAEPSVCLF